MPADIRDSRDRMVDVHIAGRGIRDRRLLTAMREVPREAFVDIGFQEFAYEDSPLPIAEQQTISQPYIVALMLEAAEIGSGDRVLEVGAGSGQPHRGSTWASWCLRTAKPIVNRCRLRRWHVPAASPNNRGAS